LSCQENAREKVKAAQRLREVTDLKGGGDYSCYIPQYTFWPPIQPRNRPREAEELKEYVATISSRHPPWSIRREWQESPDPVLIPDPFPRRPLVIVDGGPKGFHLEPLLPPGTMLPTPFCDRNARMVDRNRTEARRETKGEKEKGQNKEQGNEQREAREPQPKTYKNPDDYLDPEIYSRYIFYENKIRRERGIEKETTGPTTLPFRKEDCHVTRISYNPPLLVSPTLGCSPELIRRLAALDMYGDMNNHHCVQVQLWDPPTPTPPPPMP
jgi:hypothetical protein